MTHICVTRPQYVIIHSSFGNWSWLDITFGFPTPVTIPPFLFLYQHPNVFSSVTYHLTVYNLPLSQQGHVFFIDRCTRVDGLCANVSENTTEIISGGNVTQYPSVPLRKWRIFISIYANNNIYITIYIECVVRSRLILFNLASCFGHFHPAMYKFQKNGHHPYCHVFLITYLMDKFLPGWYQLIYLSFLLVVNKATAATSTSTAVTATTTTTISSSTSGSSSSSTTTTTTTITP